MPEGVKPEDRRTIPAAERFRRWECSSCGHSIGPDEPPAAAVHLSLYRPMDPGPSWDAVGDWQDPFSVGVILCGTCVDIFPHYRRRFVTTPQITTDDEGVHRDQDGNTYEAVDKDGELSFEQRGTDHE